MKRVLLSLIIIISVFSLYAYSAYHIENEKTKDLTFQLVSYWAPIIMQDTDDTNYRADYITCYTYDGDYIAINNWENLNNYPLKGYVYYWLVETETHYFIGYAVFHPRDWSDWLPYFDEHENDLEGVLLCIKKNGAFGEFILMITIAHLDFYSYKDFDSYPSNNVTDGHEDIDGDVEFLTVTSGDNWNQSGVFCGKHPYIYVEAKGHGIRGAERWEDDGFPGGDGIVYYPSVVAEEPSSGTDNFCRYALIPIDDLWNRRYDPIIFKSYGTFDKDNGYGNANAPWAWDDKDDGDCFPPDFFDDPAYLVEHYHDGLGNFSNKYVRKSWNYIFETFHNCRSDYDRTIWWKTRYRSLRIHFQRLSLADSDYVQIIDQNNNVICELRGTNVDFYSPVINSSIVGIRIRTYTANSWGYSADYIIEEIIVEELKFLVTEPPIVALNFLLLLSFFSLLNLLDRGGRRNYHLILY